MSAREKAIRAHKALLNGNGVWYFERRGLNAESVRAAWLSYAEVRRAFTYPCIAKGGDLLGIHHKSKARDAKGKRGQC